MADKQVISKSAGQALLAAVESTHLRKDIPEIKSGDTVRLQVKVVEGNRERLQPFEGVVMRLRGGGVNRNFTVRRMQLYFLRGLTRKAARLKELRPMTSKEAAAKEVAKAARSGGESAESGGGSGDE